MPNAEELFPLPEDERRALKQVTIESEVLIIAAAIVGAFILTGLSTGNWGYAIGFGWLLDILKTMTPHWAMIALPVIMVGAVIAVDKIGLAHFASYREQKAELTKGLNGELPRLSLGWIAITSILAGVCEELLFRYVLMGLLMLGFSLFASPVPAAIPTIVISSLIFTLVHLQYRNLWSIGLVVCLSLIFGIGYLATGSLLVVMFAHAVYDAAIMLYERHRMKVDPNYFSGETPPSSAVIDILASSKNKKKSKETEASESIDDAGELSESIDDAGELSKKAAN